MLIWVSCVIWVSCGKNVLIIIIRVCHFDNCEKNYELYRFYGIIGTKKSKKKIIINKLFLKKLGSSTRPHSAYVQSAKVEEYN